jgi:hypothetical protein
VTRAARVVLVWLACALVGVLYLGLALLWHVGDRHVERARRRWSL